MKRACTIVIIATTSALAQPPAEVPADDIDLGMLGLDPDAPAFDDKLQIYGFADFSWSAVHFTEPVVPDSRNFAAGNLNLYLTKNLSARWRTLGEVRLLFAPNGSTVGLGTDYTNTAVSDAANYERPISWGGISIERVYVEYDIAPYLTVRAGRFLTPYGIWNTDHGSPVIIGTQRPYIVGEQFFPERQTGLELFGRKPFGEYTLEYHATVSNGRNPFEATRDPDKNVAFGGRLALATPSAIKAGVSGYHGRATEATASSSSGAEYDETALGADAAWDRGGLHAQAEVLVQQRRYTEGRRAPRGAGFAPDGMTWGAYGLVGYRLQSLWHVMPYVMVEHYKPFDPTLFGDRAVGKIGGLNFRPLATVVLKAEYTHAQFGDGGLLTGAVHAFRTQAAWVF